MIQYIEPLILNFNPHNTNLFYRCERLLRLALPNTYCWIVFFFIFFHLYLNILSELLYFADRKFYTVDIYNILGLVELQKFRRILETMEFTCAFFHVKTRL